MGTITPLSSTPSDYTVLTTDYVGNMIYENGALKEILLPEGYFQNGTFYYYLKDHLGDNRVTINSSGTVVEKSHYYPSGTRFFTESTSNSLKTLPYRYNGKELEAMNGLNQMDYGARRRFAGLPIWTSVDPLAEKHYSVSPYAYCSGNPVNRIDPDGRIDYNVNKKGEFYQANPLKDKIKSFFGIKDKNDRILMEGSSKVISKLPAGSIGKIDHNNEKSTQFEIKSNAVAERVFKDVSRNTIVEWARVEHSTGNNTSNTLTTNHLNGSVDGAKVAIDYQNAGQSVPLMEHSHQALDSNVPTWNMRIQVSEDGDMINAKSLPNTTQRALDVPTNQYEYYNEKGVYKTEDAGK